MEKVIGGLPVRCSAQAQHGLEIGPGIGGGGGAEQHPANHDRQQGIAAAENPGQPGQPPSPQQLFPRQQQEEPCAPQHEGPRRPVPQPGEQPHSRQVEDVPNGGAAASSQGDIDVIPEPGGQGDVPPPPELGDRLGDIGVVEVFQEMKAKHPPQADGHVGIGGEVEVNLEGVCRRPRPCRTGGHGGGGLGEHSVGDLAHGVGQQHFFAQPEQEPRRPLGEFGQGLLPAGDLPGHGGIAYDGPGHQLGEQGYVEGYVEGVALAGGVSAVHVDDVAQPLEGEKGDADGQNDWGQVQPDPQAVEVGGEEPGVLEPAQHPKAQQDGGPKPRPPGGIGPPRGGQQPAQVVDGSGAQQHRQVVQPAAGVEEQAESQQHSVAPGAEAPGQAEVAEKQRGKEEKEEQDAAENHRITA